MKIPKVSKSTKDAIRKQKASKIDVGCGANKQGADWFGIDYRKLPGVNLVHDLEKQPWPIASNSFNIAISSHVIEHIQPTHGIFIDFMNSVWRILKPGGEFLISAPYATSIGMFRDPTHVNFINEQTFAYFDPEDEDFKGGLYGIYAPLPWRIKVNTYNPVGNIEVVLVKRDIFPRYKVDKGYLKTLKANNKIK